MLFNSFEFLLFLPLVFTLYWFVFKNKLWKQNLLVLVSSYLFYGWWDYRFLGLILLSTIVDYFIAQKIFISSIKKRKKIFLGISIIFNLSVLGFFKYYNFFLDSFIEMFRFIGYDMQNQWTLKIILPVGISFYTFQTMSYTIDVYRKDLKPTRDFISFASFVSFFPQLVAGPIERATNLLPQILEQRIFNKNQVVSGLRLITWGLFKKVVIADSLSPLVNTIFENYNTSSGVTLWLGAIYFSFQIYCDFSGYSDIAIGTSKLFGFELMSNFKFPYFSRNIGEFWRKWHISLSTWFRDYLYIPLGGSKGNKLIAFKNIFVIFIVSGFWHGANWTFLFWGLLHALFYIPSFIFKKNRKFIGTVSGGNKNLPTIKELFQMLSTFLFVMLGWVFFRSETIVKAFDYLKRMFFDFSFDFGLTQGLYYVLVLICLDWIIRKDERNIYPISSNIVYISILIWAIILYSFDNEQAQFIYFQF